MMLKRKYHNSLKTTAVTDALQCCLFMKPRVFVCPLPVHPFSSTEKSRDAVPRVPTSPRTHPTAPLITSYY